jgi:hypothetical protein
MMGKVKEEEFPRDTVEIGADLCLSTIQSNWKEYENKFQ